MSGCGMSERPETIADIIAEMNRVEVCAGGEPCLRDYADRLEAALRRERGDCAKLREALEKIRDLTEPCEGVTECEVECNTVAKAALAAPPRNCDVGVPEERIQRWSKFCKARSKKLPPIHGFEWEDYPYKEGDAK